MSWRSPRLVALRFFMAGLAMAGAVTIAAEGNGGAARRDDAATAGGATGENAATTTSTAPVTFWEALGSAEAMRAFAASLSDDELLGQAFMLGYPDAVLTPFLLGWIEGQGLGGVKIFPRNVASLEQLAAHVDELQAAAQRQPRRIPLLIATDLEGGWIDHVKHEVSKTPGNLAIGAAGMPEDAYRTGRYLGLELAALGINMNFAPTVDVYSSPDASVIGPRAFSSDPVQTGLLAVAYFRGLQSAGIIATAKHYPGHGAADRDSHLVLPRIAADRERLWDRELVPYRFLIREGLPAIMSGHLAFPAIADEDLPASLSPVFMDELLRDRLGFEGIVVTDDLEMTGVVQYAGSPAEAVVAAIEAGNDLALVSHTPAWQEQAWEVARRRMKEDEQFRSRVAAAAVRVLEAKRAAVTATPPLPLSSAASVTRSLAHLVPAPGAAEFFFSSAARAVTVVRDAGLPLPVTRGRILLAGQHRAFLDAGRRRYPDADVAKFPWSPFYFARQPHLSAIPATARGYDTIIFELANFNSLEILTAMEPLAERIVVLSALTPVYLREVPWVHTAVAVYGNSAASFDAGFAVLAGDFPASGRWPLDFAGAEAAAADGAP
ncbi:MAG: glycoside hydrolase family 3 protein [Spirochaetaceae bacterium]|nr:glycoside hydrolase family 3 protein [Spirochaetaceae bacterium]